MADDLDRIVRSLPNGPYLLIRTAESRAQVGRQLAWRLSSVRKRGTLLRKVYELEAILRRLSAKTKALDVASRRELLIAIEEVATLIDRMPTCDRSSKCSGITSSVQVDHMVGDAHPPQHRKFSPPSISGNH